MNHLVSLAVISENSGITLGIAFGAIACAAGGTWWIASLVNKLKASVDNAVERLVFLEVNGYTKAEAAEVALRTAVANPGFRVPDPRDPSHFIEVGHASEATIIGHLEEPS